MKQTKQSETKKKKEKKDKKTSSMYKDTRKQRNKKAKRRKGKKQTCAWTAGWSLVGVLKGFRRGEWEDKEEALEWLRMGECGFLMGEREEEGLIGERYKEFVERDTGLVGEVSVGTSEESDDEEDE